MTETSPRTKSWSGAISVAGSPGYWIEGPHQLVLQEGTLRLGGGVLIWTRNGVTYRLESTLSKADALVVARRIG